MRTDGTEDGRPVTLIREDAYEVARQNQEDKKAHDAKVRKWLDVRMKQFQLCKDARSLQEKRSVEEIKFDSGVHWSDDARRARDDKGMVVIEVNRTPQFLNQVANEQRMTRPNAVIKPVGNGADEETAQIKQAMIRSIDGRSQAEDIRDDAFYRMLQKGWAHWQLSLEYESDRSFKKVIRVRRIANDFSVYKDPASTEFDGSDANFWFITDDMPLAQYKEEHTESKLASLDTFESLGDQPKDWIGDGVIRVCTTWYKERKKEKLYALADDMMADGKFEDELEKDADGKFIGVAYAEGEPMFRWSMRTHIMWAKFNAVELLNGNPDLTDGTEPVQGAQYIPIISLYGRRALIEDRMVWMGMVRDAMEPCLALDYWLSAVTEMVALGPKAPWIVAFEAIAQYKEMWDSANIENYAALYYDKTTPDGQELPAPFRNFGEPPIQGMAFILKFAEDDLKRVMGIYNAALGAPGPESSGIAIKSRQGESDVANYNFMDNLKRSIAYETRVKLDWMKVVYSAKQAIQIVRPEADSAEEVRINETFPGKDGKPTIYDMTTGEYDTEIEVGPAMGTRREMAAAGILDYLKVDPGAAPFVGDILAKNLDFPDKTELAKRLRARVPPGVIDDNGPTADIPQQFKTQYQQQSQALEAATQKVQELMQALESKQAEWQHEEDMKAMELASQERRAAQSSEVQVALAELKAKMPVFEAIIANLQSSITDMSKQKSPSEWQFDEKTQRAIPPPVEPPQEQQAAQ